MSKCLKQSARRVILGALPVLTLVGCQLGTPAANLPTATVAPATAVATSQLTTAPATPTNPPTVVPATPTSQPTAAPAVTATALAEDGTNHEVLFSVPQAENGITYRSEGVTEQQIVGPDGFAVAPDGSFWIADTMALRLLHYDAQGNQLAIVPLDDADRSVMAVRASATDVWVLDLKPTPGFLIQMAPDGTRRAQYILPAGYDLSSGLANMRLDENGQLIVEKAFDPFFSRLVPADGTLQPQPLDGLPFGDQFFTTKAADFNNQDEDHTRGEIRAGDMLIEIDTDNALGGLQIIGFAPDGSFYTRMEELGPDNDFRVDQTMRHYAADGTLLGMARFPLDKQYIYVRQSMAVGPDGNLYAMLTRPDSVELVRVRFVDNVTSIFS